MPETCAINIDNCFEIVLADSAHAKSVHQSLFHYAEQSYFVFGSLVQALKAMTPNLLAEDICRLHIVAEGSSILKLFLNTDATPSVKDALIYLQSAGIQRVELEPFMKADVGDVFTWLFYAKRLDTLRKLCNNLKKHLSIQLSNNKLLRTDCHLVLPDINHIVASSL